MNETIHSPEHARLGRAVRELRARRGLSQEELGFRSGLHRNYVGAIERGEINPTFRVLLKLERGLQLPLSEIIQLWERRAHEPVPQRVRRRART
jgi:transcriptional regulator with XRE-family HTH domain